MTPTKISTLILIAAACGAAGYATAKIFDAIANRNLPLPWSLAAFMGIDRSPFLTDAAERMRTALAAPGADGLAAGQFSDHLVMVDVYEAWRSHDTAAKAAGHCVRNGLCPNVLNDISQTRVALAGLLAKAGFLPESNWLQAGALPPPWCVG